MIETRMDDDRTQLQPRSGPLRPTPGQRRAPGAPPPVPLASAALGFECRRGLNPLVNAAGTLLAVWQQIHGAAHHPDPAGLYQRLTFELKTFESNCRDLGLPQREVLGARYLLCTVLDEAVLHTPWGESSGWGRRTLLSVFHNETSGGEKCFALLERLLAQPAAHVDLLELFYLCLAQGFEGRYRVMRRGREQLDAVTEQVYLAVRRQRGDFERGLSPTWRGLGQVKKSLAEYLPLWVVASVCGALLVAGYAGFNHAVRKASEPALQALAAVVGGGAL